ncbi:MAG: formyltransferase family protein, partial [Thermomicrobiales bacterium]
MPHSATSLPVTFFGRHCHFSAKALQALLQAGHRIDLVVVPGSAPGCRVVFDRSRGPRLSLSAPAPPPTVAALAWSAGTSLVEVDRGELESLPRRFRSLSDGVGVAACFPWKLPPVVLDRPPMGMLNVHPSLLPAHRGSDPVFWTVRAGERVSGATVHRMTEELDAGPSLAQASFDVALRSRASDIESRAVDVGIRLLIDVLATLSA